MDTSIIETGKLDFQLKVLSPFIVCFHHKDQFPKGDANLAPVRYLPDRIPGNDFRETAPWRMYHGDRIPGFPIHPHRGFETLTVVTKGWVDHADGLGCGGRYGDGDVQWMTAGRGLQHAEMFPLLKEEKDNPMELFQIWLNLPAASKFVPPHYKMLWNEEIPVITVLDDLNRKTSLRIINGTYKNTAYYAGNPDSWAFDPAHHVNIWLIKMDSQGRFHLPEVSDTANRVLYFYEGDQLKIDGIPLSRKSYAVLKSGAEILLENQDQVASLLLLEGEPINEPVAAYGPFVMNTYEEIRQAYEDFQKTQFGGWPWDEEDPVHPADSGRFAGYPDGTIERPPGYPEKGL